MNNLTRDWVHAQIKGLSDQIAMFGRILRSLGILGLIVLLVACLLICLGEVLQTGGKFSDVFFNFNTATWRHMPTDIGIGLIVALVAVVGYELMLHAPKIAEWYDILRSATEQSREATRASLSATEALKRASADSHTIIKQHIEQLFPDREHADFRNALVDLLKRAAEIRGHQKGIGEGKESIEYVRNLGWLATRFLQDPALSLAKVSAGLKDRIPSGVCAYAPPDRQEVAREILAAQMRCMGNNDTYTSVANLNNYKSSNNSFHAATTQALSEGLTINRIFNIVNLEKSLMNDKGLFQQFKSIVNVQKNLAGTYSKYNIRFFGRSAIMCLDKKILLDARLNATRESFENAFFGLFTHQNGDMLLFDATASRDVSKFSLSYCGNKNSGDPHPHDTIFAHLWKVCEGAPNPFEGQQFDPRWMNDHCKNIVTGHSSAP